MSDNVGGPNLTKDLTKEAEPEVVDAPAEDPDNDVGALDETDDFADEADSDDETIAETTDSDTPKRKLRRDIWHRQITVKPVPVILALLLLISGGVAGWLYFRYHQPDERTNPSVARAAISAASDGTVALLSYSPDTLEKDFATAKSHLSGDFLSYYDQFTQQIVAPAAKQKALKTTAHVMRAAVQELHPDSAVVLLFVDQSTTSKDNPDPSMAASSVLVNLALVDGKWLITKFTPV